MANLPGTTRVLAVNGSPFFEVFPNPIVAKHSPTQFDTGLIGQLWINSITQVIYMCVHGALNNAVWVSLNGNGNGITWQVVGTNTQMAKNNGYLVTDQADYVELLLPVTAAVGDTFYVATAEADADSVWKVTQNAGQYIIDGVFSSTVGVTGGIEAQGNSGPGITLVCSIANTAFVVIYTNGDTTLL